MSSKPDVFPSSLVSDADIFHICDLVREAGELAAAMREGVNITEKTGPHDRVTEADYELSRMLTSRLHERFPTDVVISEEDSERTSHISYNRVWLVDPIDGTHNYIVNDGQYTVMVGLLIDSLPVFGWVYAPATTVTYLGGPLCGAWKSYGGGVMQKYERIHALEPDAPKRIMMGFRDRKTHPWVNDLTEIQWIKAGSVGLKIAKILDDEADMFIHLSGKLKLWDTAAPAAIALGAGLEVGQLESDQLPFQLPSVEHDCSVIIGRPGSLNWSRAKLQNP